MNSTRAEREGIKLVKIIGVEPDRATDLIMFVEVLIPQQAQPMRYTVVANIGLKREFIKLWNTYELVDEQGIVGVHLCLGMSHINNSPWKVWHIVLPNDWIAAHKLRNQGIIK
jgi:hypothetical protein